MFARVIAMSTGVVDPRWMTVMVTLVPAAPRMLAPTWSNVMPEVETPSTAVIWSPALTPAAAAGVPAMTLSTLNTPESLPSSTPIPATLAFREAWNAAYSVGVRKVEWPVSPRLSTMPLIEP